MSQQAIADVRAAFDDAPAEPKKQEQRNTENVKQQINWFVSIICGIMNYCSFWLDLQNGNF